LAPLAEADCLLVRAPNAPALAAGGLVDILPLDF
jgi:molybdopterin biosynthesis enzyme